MEERFYLNVDFKRKNHNANMKGELEFHIECSNLSAANILYMILTKMSVQDPEVVYAALSQFMEDRIKEMG